MALTPEEYLARERLAFEKSEYLDGTVVAMAGARTTHNLVNLRIAFAVQPALEGRPCEIQLNEMKVRIPGRGYFYPDAVVFCDPVYEDEREDVILNPLAVFEVLSPSTRSFDLFEKRNAYLTIPSLRELVFLDEPRRTIEAYRREGNGWVLRIATEEPLHLPAVGATLDPARLFAPSPARPVS